METNPAPGDVVRFRGDEDEQYVVVSVVAPEALVTIRSPRTGNEVTVVAQVLRPVAAPSDRSLALKAVLA